MRKIKWFAALVSLVLIASFLAGCTPAKKEEPAIKQISIGGAGTSGTFYVIAAGIADLFGKKLNINSVAEVTAGSVENAKLLDQKKVEMAIMQVDVGLNAINGAKPFENKIEMTAIAPMYPNVVQIITLKKSNIEKVSDLVGKKISVGSPGSGILATNEIILNTLGISMEDIKPQYLSFAETTNAFRDGAIDAAIVNTAAPAPFVVDLETSHPIKLIELSDEEITKFTSTYPYFVKSVIPKDAYKSLDGDVNSFAVWITLAARKDLPEDVVYDATKTIMENQEFLKSVTVMAKYVTLENVEAISGIPYHPGAAKYYKEKGIEVPTK